MVSLHFGWSCATNLTLDGQGVFFAPFHGQRRGHDGSLPNDLDGFGLDTQRAFDTWGEHAGKGRWGRQSNAWFLCLRDTSRHASEDRFPRGKEDLVGATKGLLPPFSGLCQFLDGLALYLNMSRAIKQAGI